MLINDLNKLVYYESCLIDIPLEDCKIELDRRLKQVRFFNQVTNEIYLSKLFNFRSSYRYDWTSAFIFTVLKEKLNYYLTPYESMDIIQGYIEKTQGYFIDDDRFYLRVDPLNKVYGIISRTFCKTDKNDIHEFILRTLQIQYELESVENIKTNQYIENYGKIIVEYCIDEQLVIKVKYGNDTGFSAYHISSWHKCSYPVFYAWKHNQDVRDLYELLIKSIFIEKEEESFLKKVPAEY